MPMHNLIEYSDNYSKISRSLRQYYRDDPNDNKYNLNHLNSRLKKQEKLLLLVIQKMLK